MKWNKIIVGGVLLASLVMGVKSYDPSCTQACDEILRAELAFCSSIWVPAIAVCQGAAFFQCGICKVLCAQ